MSINKWLLPLHTVQVVDGAGDRIKPDLNSLHLAGSKFTIWRRRTKNPDENYCRKLSQDAAEALLAEWNAMTRHFSGHKISHSYPALLAAQCESAAATMCWASANERATRHDIVNVGSSNKILREIKSRRGMFASTTLQMRTSHFSNNDWPRCVRAVRCLNFIAIFAFENPTRAAKSTKWTKKKQKHGKKKNDSKHFACMNDLAMLVVRGRGEGEAADAGRDFTYFLRAYMCCIDNAGLGVWRMRDDREKISLSKLVWAGEHEFYR